MQLLLLNLGFGEIFLIGFVYLMFFGSKNFPTIMRDFGRFIHSVKKSLSDIYRDINSNNNY